MRGGLLARQDVAVGVPAQHAEAGQVLQKLKHLRGARAEQDQVAEGPPLVHVRTGRILQYRSQRYVVSVDVGDNSKLHARKPIEPRPYSLAWDWATMSGQDISLP